ncbi:hypothetical protein Hanom_Chr13g01240661 [Helianthus anomalus]
MGSWFCVSIFEEVAVALSLNLWYSQVAERWIWKLPTIGEL